MLELLSKGHRVINIDETWLNQTDFRRMKWRVRNETNSMVDRTVSPRVSMLAAIDTSGKAYFALTQVNTDSDVFMLFLKKLFDKLSAEDRGWKASTYLMIDGAGYHRSGQVREMVAKCGVKVVLTSPYSYEGVPVELLFHLLKRTNINPARDSTGKK